MVYFFIVKWSEKAVYHGSNKIVSEVLYGYEMITNNLSINQLAFAMNLGKLDEQIVLKSKKAFSAIKFIKYETVDASIYFEKRDMRDKNARIEYTHILEIDDNESKKINFNHCFLY